MLPHSLWKFQVQICDKSQTSQLVKRKSLVIRFGRQCSCKVYNSCSKCAPFARIHAQRCFLRVTINCIINDAVVHAMPNVQQTILQFFLNTVQLRLMHLLLDITPHLVINRIKVGAIRQPQIWRNENGCWLLKKLHSVTCPVCSCGVQMCCWKNKKSLDTSSIADTGVCHGMSKMRFVRLSCEMPTVTITDRLSVDLVRNLSQIWTLAFHR